MLSGEGIVDQVPIVVLDTETTGLNPHLGDRVVELGAIRLESWREVARLDQLVNPGRPISPGASRVNGIYDVDVRNAPPFAAVIDKLNELLDGAVIVAHNAQFDAGFLANEYLVAAQTRPDLSIPDNPWLCTMLLARRHFHFASNSLANVARSLSVTTDRSHRAISDARTTAGVFRSMANQLQTRQLHTLDEILAAQGRTIRMRGARAPVLPPPLQQALSSRCRARIAYDGPTSVSDRVIEPLYATERDGHIYLVAFCHLRQAQRTFRLDRIQRAQLVE
jgi:DNA polymerase-3 subunit epsilon